VGGNPLSKNSIFGDKFAKYTNVHTLNTWRLLTNIPAWICNIMMVSCVSGKNKFLDILSPNLFPFLIQISSVQFQNVPFFAKKSSCEKYIIRYIITHPHNSA
jgi:hypothetical protein